MAPHTEASQVGTAQAFDKASHIKPYTVFLLCFLGSGSASMGYAASIIATTLTQPSFHNAMHLDRASNATALVGATMGLYYTGGVFGGLASGYISHKFGRKMCALIGALLVLIPSALLTASVDMGMFITFRFFVGWGSFQLLAAIPVWMAELVPPKRRGMLVAIHPVMVNFGYTVASYTGIGFYYYKNGGNNQWRGPIGLTMAFPAILLAGMYWMPESPRYLLSKGRTEEAWNIIHKLHSDPKDSNDTFAKREFYQIQRQMQLDNSLSAKTTLGNFVSMFKKPSMRKRAFMSMFLTFSQMSSGALVINNYGGAIYASLGYDTPVVLQIQGGYQLTAWVMTVAGLLIVDRFPRNKLLSFGFLMSMISVTIEAALQKHYLNTANKSGLAACAAMLFVNTTAYCLFLEGPSFSFLAEIWPSFLRGEGYALSMAVYSAASIVWLQSAPTAFASIHWKFYIIFIVFDALATVVIWFYPNTLGKPLEEIAALFGDDDLVAVYQKDLNDNTIYDLSPADLDQGGLEKNTEVLVHGIKEDC